jgi:hypothetical protein
MNGRSIYSDTVGRDAVMRRETRASLCTLTRASKETTCADILPASKFILDNPVFGRDA